MHDIEFEAFKIINKMQQLQKEIDQWNTINLTRKSMWLIKQENRINKNYSFIKISLSTKNDLKNVTKKKWL